MAALGQQRRWLSPPVRWPDGSPAADLSVPAGVQLVPHGRGRYRGAGVRVRRLRQRVGAVAGVDAH